MSNSVEITPRLVIPLQELRFAATRSSGPGGQHVNTADTRVELRWNVGNSGVLTSAQKTRLTRVLARRLNRRGELVLTCGTRRSQRRNKQELLERLAKLVRRALARPRRRIATAPSSQVRERRLQDKQRRAKIKRSRQRPDQED